MKRIADFLFSAPLMAVILAVFAISIGFATFIENDFGSVSARALVYNARWFELLLLLGSVNLTGRIIVKRLYTRQKFSVFVFHVAFVIILAGAVTTRYSSWEGTLSVREGQTTHKILSAETYLQITAGKGENAETHQFRISLNPLGKNKFIRRFAYKGQDMVLRCKSYIPNAFETVEPSTDGMPVAEFIYADPDGRKSMVIALGENKAIGDRMFSFGAAETDSQTVVLSASGDSLYFTAPFTVTVASMSGEAFRSLQGNTPHRFLAQQLYTFQGQVVLLNRFLQKGTLVARSVPEMEGQTYDAVIGELESDSEKKEIILMGKSGYPGIAKTTILHGIEFVISYGSVYKDIPFELKLNDFIVERYPGSQSPSSFESRVTLTDSDNNINTTSRIYMNNILKYRGYRFYQASFDSDEKGTILSVNHDRAGTSVTYAGYLIMGIGMILSLFNRKSRFRWLSTDSDLIKKQKKTASLLLLLLCMQSISHAQEKVLPEIIPIDQQHAGLFGRMLVQDNNGRIEPMNTLSSEVIRKLSRKGTYKGMNADQIFLGMMVDPSAWQHEPVIRVTDPEIIKLLGSNEKYYAFSTFFDDHTYVLQDYVERAFRKTPATRSKFDNDIIRLNEKVNICYLIFSGNFMRLFPVPEDSTNTWYNQEQIKGRIKSIDSVFAENITYLYIQSVQKSIESGDWKGPDEILNAISAYQAKYSGAIIPSARMVSIEIILNRSDVFSRISKYYGLVGLVLLILQFAGFFTMRLKLKVPVIVATLLIILIFCMHTAGLGLRWYVSGHAPWSNGYEALTYIAWATVLAGLIFASKSTITLSVTSVLAFLILFVAHLSWMDPQITNLVPVLKSYWLVIHVATITASYGFLAMGALLAFLNLLLMIISSGGKRDYIKLTLRELSNTIEMSQTIGLYLLSIGVFLGAVWANESWGRYWGWDPKETWALITMLVYAFVLHMRMIPGLKGMYAFNLASLLAIGSVIMTYFGVNYYLSGLHSYAKGDPLPIPPFVYYTAAVIMITALIAYFSKGDFDRVTASQEDPASNS